MSYLPVLGRVPSGLFVLTARNGSEETGMLASWVMQAGFEPPMISLALRKDRYVTQWLTDGLPFVLNLLGKEHKSLMAHFGRGFKPGEPAFVGLSVERTQHELAVLLEALGHLECVPRSHVDTNDHRLFLAEVTGGRLQGDDHPAVHIRKSGAHY
jgi:flavin reductase (DIM6/NTAB) family NADH-FMN oxidoreductase RutF